MRRIALVALATLLTMLLWGALVFAALLLGWGRAPLAAPGDSAGFLRAASARMDTEARGNAVLVLIERGRVVGTHAVSRGRPVNGDTLFQVASLSKWVSATGVMTLVEAGRIDLDAPVSRYLRRWSLPPGAFANDGVTVRRLLSHTAGLTDNLGYAGFAPGQPLQTLEQSLTRAADASPGRDGVVRVGAEPGSVWAYSGGGYTLLQLLVEDVTGEPFATYMQRAVLAPLGMARSTYELLPGTANVAEIFGPDGRHATHYRFTAKAAAALYTSADDMARFIQAQVAGPRGEAPGRGVLRPASLAAMRTPHAWRYGVAIWGLGTVLYSPNRAGGFVVGHDGTNFPAINTTARVDPATGDGIVLLETGNELLATEVAGEWVYWNTGEVDLMTFVAQMPSRIRIVGIGAAVIFILGCVLASRVRRPRQRTVSGAAGAEPPSG